MCLCESEASLRQRMSKNEKQKKAAKKVIGLPLGAHEI